MASYNFKNNAESKEICKYKKCKFVLCLYILAE